MIAEHEGSFTPFEADVTDVLCKGDNFLALEVNNARRADAIPAMSFDWWNYGGITREVMLLSVPQAHIKDYFVRLVPGSRDRIAVDALVSAPGQKLSVSIPSLKLNASFDADAEGRVHGEMKARKLKLWAPLKPVLYPVTVSYGEDSVTEDIGFREISVSGTKILVNGEETFLKSISFHEEIPMEKRRACSEADAHLLVDAALELGCNTIRLAHYPQSEHIVRYAESKGLLIWEEIPLWQGIDFAGEETYAKA